MVFSEKKYMEGKQKNQLYLPEHDALPLRSRRGSLVVGHP